MDERRAIIIFSALLFFPDPEGKRGDGDCVWHEKKSLISIRKTHFEAWIKTKEPLAFMEPITCRIKDIQDY